MQYSYEDLSVIADLQLLGNYVWVDSGPWSGFAKLLPGFFLVMTLSG